MVLSRENFIYFFESLFLNKFKISFKAITIKKNLNRETFGSRKIPARKLYPHQAKKNGIDDKKNRKIAIRIYFTKSVMLS